MSPCSVDVDIAWVAACIFAVALCLVIIQLWIEVNTARRIERREVRKEIEERVRINKGEEMKMKKIFGGLRKFRTFPGKIRAALCSRKFEFREYFSSS